VLSRAVDSRRHVRVALTVLCMTVGILAISGAPAQAAITHPYTGTSFGPGGVGSGEFGVVGGVAFDQASGDVFVLDKAEGGRVYKFDAAGDPVDFSSSSTNVIEGVGSSGAAEEEIAVDESTGPDAGDIYVANAKAVMIYSEAGTLLGELTGGETCGVAVDPAGNVYVGIYPETVRRYAPHANPVTNADEDASMSGLRFLCNVAVDAGGDVYAATYSGGVREYGAIQFGSLSASGALVDGSGRTLAVDPVSGEIFIDEVERLSQYDGSVESPSLEGTTGASKAGALSGSFGVAVDHATGDVYAGDGETVEIFGPSVLAAGAGTEAVTGISESSATFNGTVQPAGTEVTECNFTYGTQEGSLFASMPCQPGPPYTGSSPVAVTASVAGLYPDTTYYYQVIARGSSSGVLSGGEKSFKTGPAAEVASVTGLPDNRGYEMVTPMEDQDLEIYPPESGNDHQFVEEDIVSGAPAAAAADGNAVAFAGAPSADGNGSQGQGRGNQYIARRDPSGGWTQTDMQPEGYREATFSGFSGELDQAVVLSHAALTPEAPAGFEDLYVRNKGGSFGAFSTVTPPNRDHFEFGSASAEGYERVLLYAGSSADYSHQLFEANDALAPGAVDPSQRANNLYESVGGQLRTVNILPEGGAAPDASFGAPAVEGESPVDFERVISADGSRIFWSSMTTGSLYVREDGVRTSLIAEAAKYLTASVDGSRVLYTRAGDLYEDDLETKATSDLAPGGKVLGLAGASEDLGYIYFVAEAELAAGATAGHPNLYLFHDGQTRFIAPLSSGDSAWLSDIAQRKAEVTPSGHDLEFVSKRSLTGFDNLDETTGETVGEVYVYDAEDASLSCASCNPTGEPPTKATFFAGGIMPVSEYPTYQLHTISEGGSRVFFESSSALLPTAEDGKINVYEWEREGAGSCADVDGCIYLLTPGVSSADSYFVDASTNGNDVFLITRSQLVPADKNEYNDVFDARVGAVEAPAAPQCTGTGCQGAAATPPVFATPASATFDGVGNYPPPVTPADKPKSKPKPKKKTQKCVSGKEKKGKKAASQAKAKQVRCKLRKAAKKARRSKSERSGR
jgi:hypothetical protein